MGRQDLGNMPMILDHLTLNTWKQGVGIRISVSSLVTKAPLTRVSPSGCRAGAKIRVPLRIVSCAKRHGFAHPRASVEEDHVLHRRSEDPFVGGRTLEDMPASAETHRRNANAVLLEMEAALF
jgi:hypothetical protein